MSVATQRQEKTASETRNVAVSFSGKLDSSELLTGTPTIVEVTTSALTLTNKVVSTASLTINGLTVITGEAIQFTVAGGTAGNAYTIKISCGTDSTPAQTLYGSLIIDVIADS